MLSDFLVDDAVADARRGRKLASIPERAESEETPDMLERAGGPAGGQPSGDEEMELIQMGEEEVRQKPVETLELTSFGGDEAKGGNGDGDANGDEESESESESESEGEGAANAESSDSDEAETGSATATRRRLVEA